MRKSFVLLAMVVALVTIGMVPQHAEAGTVGGAVLDAAGNGIAGAMVTIQALDVRRGERPFAARIASGRGGIFRFDGVPAGRYLVSTLTRRGGARVEIAIRQDGAARVRLVLNERRGGGGGNDRN